MPLEERLRLQKEAYLKEKEEIFKQEAAQIKYILDKCRDFDPPLTEDHFVYSPTIGLLVCYPGILLKLLGAGIRDKENLTDFDQVSQQFQKKPFGQGMLYGKEFIILAHPNFRRGYSKHANFEPGLLSAFWRFESSKAMRYLSLDYDRIKIDINDRTYSEFDTWFGPRFNPDIDQIADGIVRLAPPADLDDFWLGFLFADVIFLDIKWLTKTEKVEDNGTERRRKVKVFYAEEFKKNDFTVVESGIKYHPVKYIHAEYLPEKKNFRHLDGAIHFYTEDEYQARYNQDFNYNQKNANQIKTRSEKLFKINGELSIENWRNFCGLFLTQDPLIIEYFEGKLPAAVLDYLNVRSKMSKD
ncbi:MAG: hypothetical protein ACTHNW_15515 [Mucilaginibacter sp.]